MNGWMDFQPFFFLITASSDKHFFIKDFVVDDDDDDVWIILYIDPFYAPYELACCNFPIRFSYNDSVLFTSCCCCVLVSHRCFNVNFLSDMNFFSVLNVQWSIYQKKIKSRVGIENFLRINKCDFFMVTDEKLWLKAFSICWRWEDDKA